MRGNVKEKILVHELLHTKHLRYLLAEDEIRRGEVSMDDLMLDREIGIKHIGLVIDCYTDAFGPFRTTHRSCGGIYLSLHNLNAAGRDQPRNHHLVGFVPNGGSFDTSAEPIIRSLKECASGFRTNVSDIGDVVLHVKLLSMTSDMKEANGLAGIKGVGSLAPCRFCVLERAKFNIDCFNQKVNSDHYSIAFASRAFKYNV